jgi:hypothetical protein
VDNVHVAKKERRLIIIIIIIIIIKRNGAKTISGVKGDYVIFWGFKWGGVYYRILWES